MTQPIISAIIAYPVRQASYCERTLCLRCQRFCPHRLLATTMSIPVPRGAVATVVDVGTTGGTAPMLGGLHRLAIGRPFRGLSDERGQELSEEETRTSEVAASQKGKAMPITRLEIYAILAVLIGAGIAAIAMEKRTQVIVPAFVRPPQSWQSPDLWPARMWWDI